MFPWAASESLDDNKWLLLMRSFVCPPFTFVRRFRAPIAGSSTYSLFCCKRTNPLVPRYNANPPDTLYFVRSLIVFYVVRLQRTPLCRLKTNRRPCGTGGLTGLLRSSTPQWDSCFVYAVFGPNHARDDFKDCQILLFTHTHTQSITLTHPPKHVCVQDAPFFRLGYFSYCDNIVATPIGSLRECRKRYSDYPNNRF